MMDHKQKNSNSRLFDIIKESELQDFLFETKERNRELLGKVSEEIFNEHPSYERINNEYKFNTSSENIFFEDKTGKPIKDKIKKIRIRKPAWKDDDKSTINKKKKLNESISASAYEEELREDYRKLNPKTSWAKPKIQYKIKQDKEFILDSIDENNINEKIEKEIFSSAAPVQEKPKYLSKKEIKIATTNDLNDNSRHRYPAIALEFHFKEQLLLKAAKRTIEIITLADEENPTFDAFKIKNAFINHAAFNSNGTKIVTAGKLGNKPYLILYDVSEKKVEDLFNNSLDNLNYTEYLSFSMSHKTQHKSSLKTMAFTTDNGTVPLFSFDNMKFLNSLKSNSKINQIAMTQDGLHLFTSSMGGKIDIWDMRMLRIKQHSFFDDGMIHCKAMELSKNDTYLATGSEMGVVNIYDVNKLLNDNNSCQKPIKSILSLRTEIGRIEFNHDSQIMAMCAKDVPGGYRLVHLPSCTVFSNWPVQNKFKPIVRSFAFSPNGGLLAMGNSNGRILTYKLLYYNHY